MRSDKWCVSHRERKRNCKTYGQCDSGAYEDARSVVFSVNGKPHIASAKSFVKPLMRLSTFSRNKYFCMRHERLERLTEPPCSDRLLGMSSMSSTSIMNLFGMALLGNVVVVEIFWEDRTARIGRTTVARRMKQKAKVRMAANCCIPFLTLSIFYRRDGALEESHNMWTLNSANSRYYRNEHIAVDYPPNELRSTSSKMISRIRPRENNGNWAT